MAALAVAMATVAVGIHWVSVSRSWGTKKVQLEPLAWDFRFKTGPDWLKNPLLSPLRSTFQDLRLELEKLGSAAILG